MKVKALVLACGITLMSSAAAHAQGWGGQPNQGGWAGQQGGYAGQPNQGGWGGQQQGGMNAGGLAPPGSQSNPDGPSGYTEQELQRAEREDSGRGLEFFWINAEIGGEHLGLQTFKAEGLVDADTVKTTQTGLVYGAGLGLRLVFITLGPRFRLATFSEYQLWTLNGELGLRIPLGDLEPYLTFGGGYASMGSFDSGNLGGDLNSDDVDITGYNIRGGFGLDYYLSGVFSLGVNLTGELLVLTRPGVDPSKLNSGGTTGAQAADQVYAADGSSVGAGVTLTAVAGLHF